MTIDIIVRVYLSFICIGLLGAPLGVLLENFRIGKLLMILFVVAVASLPLAGLFVIWFIKF